MISCANCGCSGHVYKSCNHPIISYGIICFKISHDFEKNISQPLYLMVNRKDSLSYVEFIRGKYELYNKTYIMQLFENMTFDEIQLLTDKNGFDVLWTNMWNKNALDETNKNYTKEYTESKEKFEILTKGYYIKSISKGNQYISIDYLLKNTIQQYKETEWGFPKGRRNFNENDIYCAIREFKEETGINPKSIRLLSNVKPLEEIFSGSNKIRYKHVYYPAKFNNFDTYSNSLICKEIKQVKWFTYNDAMSKIRDFNIERKELLKRLNQIISTKINGT